MAETAIQVPNLQDAANKLKDQIRSGFIELLTPEQWSAMITAELEAFLKPRRGEYGRDERPSVFRETCEKVFRELVEAQLKETFQGEPFKASWDARVGGVVKEWLTENQSQLIQSTILELAGLSAQSVLSAMAQRRY